MKILQEMGMAQWEELRERGSEAFNTMTAQQHQEEHDRALIFGSNIDISVLHSLIILFIHGYRGGNHPPPPPPGMNF